MSKERELFLAHMRSIGSAGFMFELDDDGNFDDMSMAYAWSAWQAAKAQAVPEGFVVLAIDDMERICRCLDDHAVYITYKASDALESIQKAMIEAQHPSSTSDCLDEP